MAYAELHCISNFSFLRGASHPGELVMQAAELGYSAIAITDECSLAGIVKAHVVAKECGIQLLVGSEFVLSEGIKLVLLAPHRDAYAQLSTLITVARRRSPKGEYSLKLNDLKRGADEQLAIYLPCYLNSNLPAEDKQDSTRYIDDLKRVFKNNVWVGFNNSLNDDSLNRFQYFHSLAKRYQLPLVACGNVHMHCRARKPLQDVLTAIQHNTAIQQLGSKLQSNSEQYLRPIAELEVRYPLPLLNETLRIAKRCEFSMDELRYDYPEELVPPGLSPDAYLRQLVYQGAHQRWANGVPPKVQEQIEKELRLIKIKAEVDHLNGDNAPVKPYRKPAKQAGDRNPQVAC